MIPCNVPYVPTNWDWYRILIFCLCNPDSLEIIQNKFLLNTQLQENWVGTWDCVQKSTCLTIILENRFPPFPNPLIPFFNWAVLELLNTVTELDKFQWLYYWNQLQVRLGKSVHGDNKEYQKNNIYWENTLLKKNCDNFFFFYVYLQIQWYCSW